MAEKGYHQTFVFLLISVIICLFFFYWVPIDFHWNSKIILSHIHYIAQYNAVNGTTNPKQSSSPPRKPQYDCSPTRRRWYADDLLCKEPPKFLKEFKNPCYYHGNNRTLDLRCLPYFHIFGVCKSGTTDLFSRLIKHPQIIPNKGIIHKETWYWTWKRYGKGTFKITANSKRHPILLFDQYTKLFDARRLSEKKVSNENHTLYSDKVTGSADPMDFWDQTQWKYIPQNNLSWSEPQYTSPDLMKHILPSIKLIVMLRDPIERLYSHYFHGGFGNSPISFHNDVMMSIKVLRNCQKTFTLRSCLYNQSVMNEMKTPLYASIYHVHMSNWLKTFPRSQIHIIRTEDFAKDLSGHLLDLFEFLELDDVREMDLKAMSESTHKYQTKRKQKAGPMLQKTKDILMKFFDNENEELVKLLKDTKFNWKDVYTISESSDFKNQTRKNQQHNSAADVKDTNAENIHDLNKVTDTTTHYRRTTLGTSVRTHIEKDIASIPNTLKYESGGKHIQTKITQRNLTTEKVSLQDDVFDSLVL